MPPLGAPFLGYSAELARTRLDALPFSDYADADPNRLPPGAQIAAGCGDGHDPADATGVCTRCGFDVLGYYADPCDACGAEDGEDCRPGCIGLAAHLDALPLDES